MFLLVSIFVVSLSSCGKTASTTKESSEVSTETSSKTSESPTDSSEKESSSSPIESSEESSSESSEPSEPVSNNLITNGDFESDTVDPFVLSNFEGSVGDISVSTETSGNKVIDVNVSTVSFNQAAPRLEYNGMTLDSSKKYELTFDAYGDSNKTIHAQVGEVVVPAAAPWFMTATEYDSYFNITKDKKTFNWFILPSNAGGADFTKLSLLIEFGKMANGADSPAGHFYLDNICIKEVTEVTPDTVSPVVMLDNAPEFFYVGDSKNLLDYAKCYDNIDTEVSVSINEEMSIMPAVDEDGKFTTVGDYLVRFEAFDKEGNKGFYDYTFQVRPALVAIDGFEFNSVAFGVESDLSDSSIAYVYSENDKATISIEDRAITITTTESADEPWYATQLFLKTSVPEKTGYHYISFDLESDVAGTITFDGVPFDIVVGTNHLVVDKYAYRTAHKFSIQLGVHSSLRQDEKNIGPCTVTFSNFKFEYSKNLDDIVAPVISMNYIDQLFVGDTVNYTDLIKNYDNRDKSNAVVEVVEDESTLPTLSDSGEILDSGTFYIFFKVTDKAGNFSTYKYTLLVKPAYVSHNGFSISEVQFGEESSVNDLTVAKVWNDQGWVGAFTDVAYSVTNYNIKLSSTQEATSDYAWFATQLFLKSIAVENSGKYVFSFDLVSDVAGSIQVNKETYDIVVGSNKFEFSEGLIKGSRVFLSIQFGTEEKGALDSYNIEINDLSLVLAEDQKSWDGFDMDVEQSGTDNVITYTDIPEEWYSFNAQTYLFGLTADSDAVVIEFTGELGQKYLFKYESTITNFSRSGSAVGTGEKQYAIINVKDLTDLNRDLFYKLVFMCQDTGATGTVTIHDFYIIDSINDFYGTDWIGYGFTIDEAEDKVTTISYSNIEDNWWNLNAQYTVDDFNSGYLNVTFTFVGTKDTIYLFKEEGSKNTETEIVATGEEQTITLDFSSFTSEQRDSINNFVLFVKDPGKSGSIIIKNIEYAGLDWIGYDDMKIAETEEGFTLTYTDISDAWWEQNAQYKVVDMDTTTTTITFTFTGVKDTTYLFKVESPSKNSTEEVIATGEEQVVTVDISDWTEEQKSNINVIVVFVKTVGASGSIEIKSMVFTGAVASEE